VAALEFFTELFGSAGVNIIGVTYTFVWIEDGAYTDIDLNGKLDVAFREIYYNNGFFWSLDGPAWNRRRDRRRDDRLHETEGHGLSQAHFGKVFIDAERQAAAVLRLAPATSRRAR